MARSAMITVTGPRLKRLRRIYGVTVQDLAQEIMASEHYVHSIECAQVPVPGDYRALYQEPPEGNEGMWERARLCFGADRFASLYLDAIRKLTPSRPPTENLQTILDSLDRRGLLDEPSVQEGGPDAA